MTYQMYLDDVRNPKNAGFVVVRSFYEAIEYIATHGFPSYISFDHDLGLMTDYTGFDFAKWLVQQDLDKNWMFSDFAYNVHSANPVGKANIEGLLNNYLDHKFPK